MLTSMWSADDESKVMSVTLATESDRSVISNLLQLMLYDVSHVYGEWIGSDGRYAYEGLDAYWIENDRFPYLVFRQRQLAGFALVMARSPISGRAPCWFLGEFFILKAQRRRGCGQAAFRQVLSRHTGDWEIAINNNNKDARFFWAKGLPRFGLNDLTTVIRPHDDSDRTIDSFMAPASTIP